LSTVTYPNLWPGVTLTYQGSGGLLKSVYHLAAGADPSLIRLRYNAPAEILTNGALRLTYQTGQMTESAPVAWQEIDGERVAVAASFALLPADEVGFTVGAYNPAYPLVIDPTLEWNTFLGGGGGTNTGNSIAVDGSGNVYVIGQSDATWGSPVRAYVGGYYGDAFVAKFNSSGTLLWNTFLGSSSYNGDYGNGIAVDGSGNVYVTGQSDATWGTPVIAHSGNFDAFVAKLNGSTGVLVWNSFLGGSDWDEGNGIAVDGSSNVYVTGSSQAEWGSPVITHSGGGSTDAFAAKLNSDGTLAWNSFLGSSGEDIGNGIAIDGSSNVYVAGYSNATWGTPVRPHSGGQDAFAAKLDNSGNLTWNSFLGSSSWDQGRGVAVDGSSNVYVTGYSNATWGTPVSAHTDGQDAFAAKLNSSGALTWNTFFGGDTATTYNTAIAVDDAGNVYVTGSSYATWGSPVRAYTAYFDAFVARLNGTTGALVWNTFLGSSDFDYGSGIAVDGQSSIYLAGNSSATWGSPVRAYRGGNNGFVVKMTEADLFLRKSASPSPAFVGTPLTYTLVVTNVGLETAPSVMITDTLPASVTFKVASVNQGSCGQPSGGKVVCAVGSVPPTQTITVTLVVTPTASGVITNSAIVSGGPTDPSGNNSATISTTVILAADLGLSKRAAPSPALVNDPFTYTLVVTNAGPSAASGVTLVDTLPVSISFISAGATQGSCGQPAGQVISCSLGSVAVGGQVTATIVVSSSLLGSVINSATVSGAESDPVTGNNSAQVTTVVDNRRVYLPLLWK
jgi:uncharacterized repeat protein (TIGR01451 family)